MIRKGLTGARQFWKRKKGAWAAAAVCILVAALICVPLFMIPGGSLMDSVEMKRILSPIMGDGKGFAVWHLIPLYPTIGHFYRLLIESPAFYQLFWNTVGMTAAILLGQLIVGLPSAWAFAAFRFRGRDFLFGLYVVLMLLPFQVMLLPQYIVLQKLHLYNHPAAVVLPAIFSTFPVFIMYRGFTQIDAEILEAAMVLSFLEYWNLVEQPHVGVHPSYGQGGGDGGGSQRAGGDRAGRSACGEGLRGGG